MEISRTLYISATLPEAKGILKAHSTWGQARFRQEKSHWVAEMGEESFWVVTGMGPKAASRGLREALADYGPFTQMVGLGVAGGLNPKSRTGDLLIPSHIQFEGKTFSPTQRLVQEFSHVAPVRFWTSGLTVKKVVRTSGAKQELFEKHWADFVDMESGAWGEVCQERNLDWCVVRSVLDGPEDSLSSALEGLSDLYGRSRGFGSLVALMRHVGGWGSLARMMGQQMPVCMESLRKLFQAWINSRPNSQ